MQIKVDLESYDKTHDETEKKSAKLVNKKE